MFVKTSNPNLLQPLNLAQYVKIPATELTVALTARPYLGLLLTEQGRVLEPSLLDFCSDSTSGA
jgi:hypothetical protein